MQKPLEHSCLFFSKVIMVNIIHESEDML